MFSFLLKKSLVKRAALTGVVSAVLAGLLLIACSQPTGGTGINAQQPTITAITGSPTAAVWNVSSANTFDLTVTASVTDGGTLTYQWYSNLTNSNSGGTLMDEKTAAILILAKADYTTNGSYYFYVIVTNTITDNGDGGNKTAAKTSATATVTVSGNSGTSEVVIPSNIAGFFQTEMDLYPMAYYEPSMGGFYFDGFAIDSVTKKFFYYMDSTLEAYWGGTIEKLIPQDDANDEPAVLIVKIEMVEGSFWTAPEIGKYLAYAYKNPAGDIVSAAGAYSSGADAQNTGVATLAEAISEYTAANGYYTYFGTYLSRPVSAEAFGNMQGNWAMEDDEDYHIIIRGTTFTEFYDNWDDPDGIYDPDDDDDMLASIGTIVDCTDTSQTSGVLYIKVIDGGYVFTTGKYIAVAWDNKTNSGIDFATGNNEKTTLAEIKSTYGSVSDFPPASFSTYEK